MDIGREKSGVVERTLAFSLCIVRLCRELEKDSIGRILSKQLLRAGTSIGANVHEAQGGQSKADFIAKMSIAHKEALETVYWLRLIKQADLIVGERLSELIDETDQLIKIISKILITSKGRKPSVS
jgi:four helix bundle protein